MASILAELLQHLEEFCKFQSMDVLGSREICRRIADGITYTDMASRSIGLRSSEHPLLIRGTSTLGLIGVTAYNMGEFLPDSKQESKYAVSVLFDGYYSLLEQNREDEYHELLLALYDRLVASYLWGGSAGDFQYYMCRYKVLPKRLRAPLDRYFSPLMATRSPVLDQRFSDACHICSELPAGGQFIVVQRDLRIIDMEHFHELCQATRLLNLYETWSVVPTAR